MPLVIHINNDAIHYEDGSPSYDSAGNQLQQGSDINQINACKARCEQMFPGNQPLIAEAYLACIKTKGRHPVNACDYWKNYSSANYIRRALEGCEDIKKPAAVLVVLIILIIIITLL